MKATSHFMVRTEKGSKHLTRKKDTIKIYVNPNGGG